MTDEKKKPSSPISQENLDRLAKLKGDKKIKTHKEAINQALDEFMKKLES